MRDDALTLNRADAHDWTFKTGRKKGVRRDKMHITVDIKDAAMLKENKHLTAHGYLEGNKTATNEFPSMFTVDYVRPKRNDEGGPKIERDEYFDDATDTHVNNWNMAELEAFDEPEELSRVRLGDKFITVLSLALAKMGDDVGGKHTEAAVEEGQRMREALEQEGNDLLGTE